MPSATTRLDDRSPVVSVLGSITARRADGGQLPLSSQRREILAILAAAAGRAVPSKRLVETLWGVDTKRTRGVLKTQVYAIRSQIDPRLTIEHANGGYRLVGDLDLLDAVRFERLVGEGRRLPAPAAARRVAEALSLWSAPGPFADVGNDLVSQLTWRLESLHDDAIVLLADAEIATAEPRSAIAHLEPRCEDAPTRGDLALRLARLYALADRQLDAIQVLSAHRRALADVGAVASRDIDALETQILRHEVVPPPAAVPAPSSGSPALLPRREWVERIRTMLRSRSVLLIGEPGVGKSTLTGFVAAELGRRRVPVVHVDVLADPYGPMQAVADAVRALQRALPDATSRAMRTPRLAAAAVRVLGGPDAEVSATSRDALLNDLIELLRSVLAATGAVLVVEDVQWLDASSAEIIATLGNDPDVRLLLTSRPATHPLVAAAPGLSAVVLPPFDLGEIDALLRLALPERACGALAEELRQQTGGNALFLGLVLDALSRDPVSSDPDAPVTLQAAVAERTAVLSQSTRDLLQLAALLGPTFPVEPLTRLRQRAAEHLRVAVEEGLVHLGAAPDPPPGDPLRTPSDRPDDRLEDVPEDVPLLGPGRPNTGRFTHGLVADALAAMVPPGTRVSLHDELCRALVEAGFSATAIAPQAVAAAELDPIRAVSACRDAAGEHAAVFEWGQVLDWARRGLDLAARHRVDDPQVEAHLRGLIGVALRHTGRPDSVRELLRAAELAERVGDAELFARVTIELCFDVYTSEVGGADARARGHLQRALELDLPHPLAVELRSAAAVLHTSSDDVERGRQLYREAYHLARGAGDAHVLRRVLMEANHGFAHPDDLDLRHEAAIELGAFDDAESRWERAYLLAHYGLVTADRELFDTHLALVREFTPHVRRRYRIRGRLQLEATAAFVEGDLDRAERLALACPEDAVAVHSRSWALAVLTALLLPLRLTQGRLGELWGPASEQAALQPGYPSWHVLAAITADAAGDTAAADALLEPLRSGTMTLIDDITWTALVSTLALPAWHRRDTRLAARLLPRLERHRDRLSWNGLSTHGPVDAGLALLHATLGDMDAAIEHRANARRVIDRFRAPHLWWPVLDELPAGDDD